ncbi:hypothetical protein AB0P17_05340 [Streptomyces sp. NPDC088124]|uniref:hypothetical protein n=1 Tax=Streptomyces sp. NPDC088124 TaxID=3154654 RepID=UPI00342A3EB7
MVKLIVRLFEPLLRGLFPAGGRHRLDISPPRRVVFRPAVVFVHGCRTAACGTHDALLLPCLRGEFERWERVEQRRRRQRRRELWLAFHGVDAGPRVIHGVEVGR